jgi:hypothetical protein
MSASEAPAAAAGSRPRAFAAIFWGGLLAGVFDITQAFVGFGLLGARPFRILQHIAGGILGARSMEMGWMSAALGLGDSLRHRVHCGKRLFSCQPSNARACRARGGLRTRVRRTGVPVHVLCRAAGLRARAGALQHRDLLHRPDWAHVFGWVADRAFRAAVLKVNNTIACVASRDARAISRW